jgi:endonuclease/exonuclease/phosphatase (EEP) superfamily protein YafD
MRQLHLITFNAGLLRAAGGLLQPAPYVTERLAALPHALIASGADLLFLQEVYGRRNRAAVADACRETFPHAASPPNRPHLGIDTGLMVLSREPIRAEFHPFRAAVWEERLAGRKGFQYIRTSAGAFVNFHATAGGLWRHPESEAAERERARQIEQMLGEAADARVFAGDLNAGPGVSDANYRLFAAQGLADAYLLHNAEAPTWDPANPLNESGPHQTSPPQRCDHIFVRGVEVIGSAIVFDRPTVATPRGTVTLSDHYGVSATMRVP